MNLNMYPEASHEQQEKSVADFSFEAAISREWGLANLESINGQRFFSLYKPTFMVSIQDEQIMVTASAGIISIDAMISLEAVTSDMLSCSGYIQVSEMTQLRLIKLPMLIAGFLFIDFVVQGSVISLCFACGFMAISVVGYTLTVNQYSHYIENFIKKAILGTME